MAFETLPVIHLEHGRFPEYPQDDAERVLTELARRFGRVVLVDAAGVRANDADLEFIQTACRKRSIWLDAGSRYATDAMDLFIAGAEAVTMRWNTLHRPVELEEAAAVCQPGTLFVGLEYPRGAFLAHRKDKRTDVDVMRYAEELGVGIVLMLDQPTADDLRRLPPAMTHRYVQGAPAPLVADAQAMGFSGLLVAPAHLPEAAP